MRYSERIAELSEMFARSVHISEQVITANETEKLCRSMANLADERRLETFSIKGRPDWNKSTKETKAGWGLTQAEEATLKTLNPYLSNGVNTSYKLPLQQKKPLVRFVQLSVGGTCHTYKLFNTAYLLSSTKEDVDRETVSDPEDIIRWAYFGGGDYPVFYRGRNFVITADLRDNNQLGIISWIKPNGKIRPMCLLKVQKTQKTVVSSKNKKLCNSVANGTIAPLKGALVIEQLPLNRNSKQYYEEFKKRYNSVAHEVQLLNIDINADGISENIGRFQFESSAGCGGRNIWLSVLSKDLSGLITGSLNDLLGYFDEKTNALNKAEMNIYKYHNHHYIEAVKKGNYGLFQLKNNKIKQVCEFGEKTKTRITKLF